jgi:hypothetical protein
MIKGISEWINFGFHVGQAGVKHGIIGITECKTDFLRNLPCPCALGCGPSKIRFLQRDRLAHQYVPATHEKFSFPQSSTLRSARLAQPLSGLLWSTKSRRIHNSKSMRANLRFLNAFEPSHT